MSDYKIEKEYEYVSAVDKDVVFTITPLTSSQRDECIGMQFSGGEALQIINRSKLCSYGIKKIENLSMEGEAVTTAKEFLKYNWGALYEDVCMEILTACAKKDPKN